MNRNRTLELNNFSYGMRRNNALSQDREHILRTLKNYTIDYVDGGLQVRKGYTRYNATVLPDYCYQLNHHIDINGNEAIFGIIGTGTSARWYNIRSTGSHDMLIDEAATSPDSGGYSKPVITWGNRFFFATNSGWYWSDASRLTESTKYYQAGIDKPENSPQIGIANDDGNWSNVAGYPTAPLLMDLNATDRYKISGGFTPTESTIVGNVRLFLMWAYSEGKSGSIRVRLETDNGGKPSGTLVSSSSYSNWITVTSIGSPYVYGWYDFFFQDRIILSKNTTYWVVLEGNPSYYNNYNATNFYLAVGYNGNTGMIYSYSTSTWSSYASHKMGFYLSGLSSGFIYDYAITYLNSTYRIESRRSNNARIQLTSVNPVVKITLNDTITDDQVDKIKLYRRKFDVKLGLNAREDEIIESFALVGEYPIANTVIYDAVGDDYLYEKIQTEDHYRLTEGDDTQENRRVAIQPIAATIWKGRIWVVEANGKTLYYSKKLEQDGASGLTGDLMPDYFPLENQMEVPTPDAIIRLEPLSGDQMALYCKNSSIWVLWGCDTVLNPFNPDDFVLKEMVADTGLTAQRALGNYRGRNIYLARKGLYGFSESPNIEYLSEYIQSILDTVSDTYIGNAVLTVLGDEVWLLIDSNNDGTNDKIYIFDLQKSLPAWRLYDYGVGINDLAIRTKGTQNKSILAADAENKYILELESGTDDNGNAIEGEIESHNLIVPNRAMVSDIRVSGYYPETPMSFDVTLIDNNNNETNYSIYPASNDDTRGSHIMTRVVSNNHIRVKITTRSVAENKVNAIRIGYIPK